MTMKISTAVAKGLLDTGSLKALMAGMTLKIYAGIEPATADAGLGGATLLCHVSADGAGAGMEFEAAAVANVIQKASSQTWSGTNVADGLAVFCRLALASDTGTASTTEKRIQGDVGIAGRFCNIRNLNLVTGAPQTVESLSIAFPLQ